MSKYYLLLVLLLKRNSLSRVPVLQKPLKIGHFMLGRQRNVSTKMKNARAESLLRSLKPF